MSRMTVPQKKMDQLPLPQTNALHGETPLAGPRCCVPPESPRRNTVSPAESISKEIAHHVD
jgi:hypothetical protein